MNVFQQYRMALPLFFPSTDLLITWQIQYRVLDEITWNNPPPHRSQIDGTLMAPLPDLNKEFDDLVQKLTDTTFRAVSNRMHLYSREVKEKLLQNWDAILRRASVK